VQKSTALQYVDNQRVLLANDRQIFSKKLVGLRITQYRQLYMGLDKFDHVFRKNSQRLSRY
jgi:hypothetical protein